eukprot:CAMPEP_0184696428 /NCGR_PEP_ID=MMETSP0313-20130426/3729_1 /TAXON_ID=2792 /ORGANISM="Porphyridium aerugineum, Strain SAG 1380-2" /LENGTH=354 /DNA_ID=CAMNT_0027155055 /DNA_START=208 /DNA_END=1272 /DNA_ORIENTATION=-
MSDANADANANFVNPDDEPKKDEFDSDEYKDRSDSGTRDIEFHLTPLSNKTAPTSSSSLQDDSPLFALIKDVPPPELVARFARTAPAEVQAAFRTTLRGMLGSLNPALYSLSLRTATANLVQLMQSCVLQGYLLRNAQYRISLTKSLVQSTPNMNFIKEMKKSLPSSETPRSDALQTTSNLDPSSLPFSTRPMPANSVEPKIINGVAIFENEDGTTIEVPVEEYVKELRAEFSALKNELVRARTDGTELIRYVQSMQPENLEQLAQAVGDDVLDAMNRVVGAVLQSQGLSGKDPMAPVEASTQELGQLLFWLMVVGYFLREEEAKLSMRRTFERLSGTHVSDDEQTNGNDEATS